MTKRMIIVLSVLMLGLMAMVGVASADTVTGFGWIHAQGDGIARLEGDIVYMTIEGNGVLWYKDGGDADRVYLSGHGRKIVHPNGWVEVLGFRGKLTVAGADDFQVRLTGTNIDLHAKGRGTVYLQGNGTYTLGTPDGVTRGEWSDIGRTIEFE